jgi:hypothetical protein
MYDVVLLVHSWLRWAVLILGVVVVVRAVLALMAGRDWAPEDRRFTLLYTISFDTQVLLGLLLYAVLSPVTSAALGDMKTAMKDPQLRFFAVEHLFLMVVGLALVHVGGVMIRKRSGVAPHKVALGFLGGALLAVLLGIPWPFVTAARPLFRM